MNEAISHSLFLSLSFTLFSEYSIQCDIIADRKWLQKRKNNNNKRIKGKSK